MSINLQELPSEINKLHHIILNLDAEKKLLLKREEVLAFEILELKEKIKLLLKKVFGKSSERVSEKQLSRL